MFSFGNKKSNQISKNNVDNRRIVTDLVNEFTAKRSELFSGKYDYYLLERNAWNDELNDIIEQIIYFYCKLVNDYLDFGNARLLLDVANHRAMYIKENHATECHLKIY